MSRTGQTVHPEQRLLAKALLFTLFIITPLAGSAPPLYAQTAQENRPQKDPRKDPRKGAPENVQSGKGTRTERLPVVDSRGIIDLSPGRWYLKLGFEPGDERGDFKNHPDVQSVKNTPINPSQILNIPPETTYPRVAVLKEFHWSPKPGDGAMALFINGLGENWEIYINGHLLAREMHLNSRGEIMRRHYVRHRMVGVNNHFLKEGVNRLVLHLVGHVPAPWLRQNDYFGLINGRGYYFGDFEAIHQAYEPRGRLLISIFSFALGIFFLLVYLRNTSARYILYYSLFSLLAWLFNFLQVSSLNTYIYDTSLLDRFVYFSLYLLFPTYGMFLHYYFYDTERPNRIIRVLIGFSIAFSFCTLVLPVYLLTALSHVWGALAVLVMLYGIYYCIQAMYRGKRDALKFLLALLLAGTLATFDILDGLYMRWGSDSVSLSFFVLIFLFAVLIANHFFRIQGELGIAAQKYNRLVEGSREIIFSLDLDGNFLTANRAIENHLGFRLQDIMGHPLLSLIYHDHSSDFIKNHIIYEKLKEVVESGRPVEFKSELRTRINEPLELNFRLEYLEQKGKGAILGKASVGGQDDLFRFCESEHQIFHIGNSLPVAERLIRRLTSTLHRYLSADDVMGVRLGVREILVNAIEHGNLNITFAEKTEATSRGSLHRLLKQRQQDQRYRNKKVRVEYRMDPHMVEYIITDEGPGFDHKKMRSRSLLDVSEMVLLHGRGILLAVSQFDEVIYNQTGNQVRLVKNFLSAERSGSQDDGEELRQEPG